MAAEQIEGAGVLRVWVDDADVAAECAEHGRTLGLTLDVRIDADPLARALTTSGPVGLWLSVAPQVARLVELARAREGAPSIVLAMPSEGAGATALGPAIDLGLVVVDEVRPLVAALSLLSHADRSAAPSRTLPAIDRRRIERALERADLPPQTRVPLRLVRTDGHRLSALAAGGTTVPAGEPRDVAQAVAALARAESGGPPGRAVMDGIDTRPTLDVLFGPPRALSDPASKAALLPYGLPMPIEELCSSPSRASAEAARIGFPVRVSLASPDLRSWDHPDLAVDGVSSATAVRDAFRQLTSLANARRPDARLLGVNVSATSAAVALLGIDARPLEHGAAILRASFADAHGAASRDETTTVIPSTPARLERALCRLRGRALLDGTTSAERRALYEALADLFLRVGAFLDAHTPAVTRLELRPLAVLPGGRIEVREACVTVGDHYVRSLDADGPHRPA